MNLDFIEDRLAGGPFEAVLTVLALLGAWLVAIGLARPLGARLGQAWGDAFGTPSRLLRQGRSLDQLGRGLAVLTTSLLFIGVVIGAII